MCLVSSGESKAILLLSETGPHLPLIPGHLNHQQHTILSTGPCVFVKFCLAFQVLLQKSVYRRRRYEMEGPFISIHHYPLCCSAFSSPSLFAVSGLLFIYLLRPCSYSACCDGHVRISTISSRALARSTQGNDWRQENVIFHTVR